jgi:hypothetical protein
MCPASSSRSCAHNLATATRPQPVLALAAAICLQAVLAPARCATSAATARTSTASASRPPARARTTPARSTRTSSSPPTWSSTRATRTSRPTRAGHRRRGRAGDPVPDRRVRPLPQHHRRPEEGPAPVQRADGADEALLAAPTRSSAARPTPTRSGTRSSISRASRVYGTTVPEHFFESLTADSLSDGFIARLLVFESAETPARQRAKATECPESIKQAAEWWGAFKPGGNLAEGAPEPIVVETTPRRARCSMRSPRSWTPSWQARRGGFGRSGPAPRRRRAAWR